MTNENVSFHQRIPLVLIVLFAVFVTGGLVILWILFPANPTFGEVDVYMDGASVVQDAGEGTSRKRSDQDAPTFTDKAATELEESAAQPPKVDAEQDLKEDDAPKGEDKQELEIAQEQTPAANLDSQGVAPSDVEQDLFLSKKPLPPIDESLYVEQTSNGPMPKIYQDIDGKKLPWVASARSTVYRSAKQKVAILLMGIGAIEEKSVYAMRMLPSDISVSVSPYLRNVDYWVKEVRKIGHEVYVELPIEPLKTFKIDPGPMALMSYLSREQLGERLTWVMTRGIGYVGLVNMVEGGVLDEQFFMKEVIGKLHEHGLVFVEQREAQSIDVKLVAQEVGVPYVQANTIIDASLVESEIVKKLTELEVKSKKDGIAVGIMRSYPLTINLVKEWLKGLEDKEIFLVPVSNALNTAQK